MTRARTLRAVPKEPPEQPVDITLALRGDIAKIDWGRVMVEGDRRSPVCVGDARKRTWRR
jgi:hypothetical protein